MAECLDLLPPTGGQNVSSMKQANEDLDLPATLHPFGRAGWYNDRMGTPILELGDEPPTSLYRLYDVGDSLLYIGITEDLKVRFATHASLKRWWPEVTRKTVELHAKRDDAAEAELAAIRTENPLHNIAGRPSGPFGIDPGDLPRKIRGDDVVNLAMLKVPPMTLRLRLLELSGIPTRSALDMLGVPRSRRSRVIAGRTGQSPRQAA